MKNFFSKFNKTQLYILFGSSLAISLGALIWGIIAGQVNDAFAAGGFL
ncbi:MAG: hypothetical protein ACLFQV_10300 [Vulcanimicrobiota bacterium]